MTHQRLPASCIDHDATGMDTARSADVQTLLERAITLRTGHRVRDLSVSPLHGDLQVHGRVRTYYLKQLVIAAAMNFAVSQGIGVAFDLEVTA